MNSAILFRLTFVLVSLVGLGSLAKAPAWASTVSAALPTRPPTSAPATSTPVIPNSSTLGAVIELRASGAPATAWTVVQWQDGLGGWHTVEGWQGQFDYGIAKIWWVAPKDFNTGPFRWVIYDKPNGTVWGVSQSFNLPASTGQHSVVAVFLK